MPPLSKSIVYGEINFYLSSKMQVLQSVIQVTRKNQRTWNFYSK